MEKWSKRIGIALLATAVAIVLYYYFYIHLPMMANGGHVL
jgi:hypothetical protein